MTGEQLEADAARQNHDTSANCAECGCILDTEEYHGISLDGEKYCCRECMPDVIRMNCFFVKPNGWWLAQAWHGGDCEKINIEARAKSREAALKRAKDYAEMTNEGVNAYVEIN